jgi:hypothetical protein
MSSRINLLGIKKKEAARPLLKKLILMRLAAIGILFLTGAFSIILFMLIALSPLPQLQKQEALEMNTLSQSKDDVAKLSVLNERMSSLSILLAKRTTYDQLLSKVQTYSPSGVTITAFSLSSDEINITVGSDSLKQLDILINNLVTAVQQKKDFSHISVANLSLDSLKNQFLLTLVLQPL